jgi:hypothetical protein
MHGTYCADGEIRNDAVVLNFGSSPKSVIEVEVSSMQRLASEVGGMNPRFI